MTALEEVFRAYRDATGCEMAVWVASDRDGAVRVEAATGGATTPLPRERLPDGEQPLSITTPAGPVLVALLPGPRLAWLALGPCEPAFPLADHLSFILPVCAQYLQSALEVEHAANELAERYEEINLLYTISEILGRTVSLEEAAGQILTEISETVGARRAVIFTHERATQTLEPIATVGVPMGDVPVIDVADQHTVSARVFRALHPLLVEGTELESEAERPFRRGAMLSVPIVWTTPRGAEPLGVVTLSDRRSGQPFSAGDQKLIAAIASQIGTAIQNTRLVRLNVDRQRLAREMQLAHELQMRLLPNTSALQPVAQVAARVVPADSVGGDFYNLFRLDHARAGVMVGDVSGHGYPAALIMALTMSASAIHAQQVDDPGETMQALLESLHDELDTTEMFMSLLYAVIDRDARTLRYANAGHPHAFVVRASGEIERLPATDPPLGMVPTAPSTQHTEFDPAGDVLLLFTDGVSDARDEADERLGEGPVLDAVLRHRAEPVDRILERIFDVVDSHAQDARRRDDLTVVVLRG
ncbi:MAG TPA: GAF domain-containing SpoIIE family protein phosphatase [Gemmatimonadaceae bacterium]|nr:GAF domain-containing SpoIIE family protein phosphatase [Gemmatimonadaceae bacterium]